MMFAPGDEVVYIGGAGRTPDDVIKRCIANGVRFPAKDAHYTVRAVIDAGDRYPCPGLLLVEIVNPRVMTVAGVCEQCFFADRFRPIKRETIEIFRAMCVSNKPLVPIDDVTAALCLFAQHGEGGPHDPNVTPSPTYCRRGQPAPRGDNSGSRVNHQEWRSASAVNFRGGE